MVASLCKCLTLAGLILLFVLCPLAGQEKESDAEKDQKALQGLWKLVRLESGGGEIFPGKKKNKNKDLSNMTIEFKKDRVFIEPFEGGKAEDNPEVFKLDPTKFPKHIDFLSKDNFTLGIYIVDGDNLWICWSGINDKNRPKEFKSFLGDAGFRVLQFKKVIPPKKP